MIKKNLTNVQKILTAANYFVKSIQLSPYKYIKYHSYLVWTIPSDREGTHSIIYEGDVGHLLLTLDGIYVYDIYLSFYKDNHKELYTVIDLEQSFHVKKCSVSENGFFIRYPYMLEVEDDKNIESVLDYWEDARNFCEEINHLKRVPNRYFYLDYVHQVIDRSALQNGNFSYHRHQPCPHRILFKCIDELDLNLNWRDILRTFVLKLFKQTGDI